MVFNDIKPKMRVVINVSNGTDLQARFISKVMKNTGEHLLVIPFRHKGQRINFTGPQIKIHMELRDGEGILYSFKNCRVTCVRKDGLLFHKIISPMKNGIENRREGRRFYVWEQGMFNVEGVPDPFFAYIKDVGVQGIAFAIDQKKPRPIKEGKKFSCTFKNKDGLEIELHGMVVRKETMDKYLVYGCRLDEPDPEFLQFVKRLEKKNTVVDVEF